MTIVVSPCPINLGGAAGSTVTATVSEHGYSGDFSLTSQAPSVASVPPSDEGTGQFVVQAGPNSGSTTIIVEDSNDNFLAVPVNNQGAVIMTRRR